MRSATAAGQRAGIRARTTGQWRVSEARADKLLDEREAEAAARGVKPYGGDAGERDAWLRERIESWTDRTPADRSPSTSHIRGMCWEAGKPIVVPPMERSRGRSGVGLLGFAVVAIVFITVVATVAFSVGRELGVVEQAFGTLQS
jgi:hypothetical protein